MKERNSFESNGFSLKQNVEKRTISQLLFTVAFATQFVIIKIIFSDNGGFDIANAPAITYFTVQTNILISLWMVFSALHLLKGRRIYRFAFDIHLSAALATYMVVNGVIFWFVLVPIFALSSAHNLFSVPNVWLHTASPVFALVLLLYINEHRPQKEFKPKIVMTMIYPVVYIISGIYYAVKGTYLYPMMNPNLVGGWVGVGVCMAATCGFVVLIHLGIIHSIKSGIEYK